MYLISATTFVNIYSLFHTDAMVHLEKTFDKIFSITPINNAFQLVCLISEYSQGVVCFMQNVDAIFWALLKLKIQMEM